MRTSSIKAIATLLLTSSALAAPQASPSSAPNATATPPSSYYLKTRVVGRGHEDKNGLYVSNYHTGNKILSSTSSFLFSSLCFFFFFYSR